MNQFAGNNQLLQAGRIAGFVGSGIFLGCSSPPHFVSRILVGNDARTPAVGARKLQPPTQPIPGCNGAGCFIFVPAAEGADDLFPQLVGRKKLERTLASNFGNSYPLFEDRIETEVRHATPLKKVRTRKYVG
jgi:hypothetical protein